jgi:hypothetical protein
VLGRPLGVGLNDKNDKNEGLETIKTIVGKFDFKGKRY